jgi:Cu/Ag efflux pump CusA
MAIVVIGGLITSTFLSLLVIPVVYTYVDDFIEWLRAMFRKFRPAHA